jgi:hypothetical protein
MANLAEAKAAFREAREQTSTHENWEGRSLSHRGMEVFRREAEAARYYIAALEEHIAIHENSQEERA